MTSQLSNSGGLGEGLGLGLGVGLWLGFVLAFGLRLWLVGPSWGHGKI